MAMVVCRLGLACEIDETSREIDKLKARYGLK